MKPGRVAALVMILIAVVGVGTMLRERRSDPPPASPLSNSSLLVVTWGPSLCTVEPANSGCRSGHVTGLGRTFLLHGLWPQPATEQYCDVPKKVSDRKRNPVPLPSDLQNRLQTMLSDPPLMTTHEWYAHGTCSGVTPPEYFSMATDLANDAVRLLNPLFADSSGLDVSARSVRQTFDAEFGGGAGMRVGLSCKKSAGGEVAFEVKLSLPAVVDLRDGDGALPLGEALSRGPTIGAGCGQARVP